MNSFTSVSMSLYLIEILHQTTTLSSLYIIPLRCILSKFYIKPQPLVKRIVSLCVVSYRNSTSNHNNQASQGVGQVLYLIEILHQTTTSIYSLLMAVKLYLIEILHQTTTITSAKLHFSRLYLIEILHQTTTATRTTKIRSLLYLIEILHQTTTLAMSFRNTLGCILSKFYIKPQPCRYG